MKKPNKSYRNGLILFILFISVFVGSFYNGIDGMRENTREQSIKSIEKAIEKAAVLCYAIEGSYPPDVRYLKDNYGIIIDESKYFYYYEVNGANILPKITVFKRW